MTIPFVSIIVPIYGVEQYGDPPAGAWGVS
jgi:hypothetical protein